jgi:DNA-binding XRE family transcriptional regulator
MTQATDAADLALAELLRAGQLPPVAERRRIRLESGATLRRMGDELGVSQTAVHHWENGVDRPSLENAVKYRRLLDQLAAVAEDRQDAEAAS